MQLCYSNDVSLFYENLFARQLSGPFHFFQEHGAVKRDFVEVEHQRLVRGCLVGLPRTRFFHYLLREITAHKTATDVCEVSHVFQTFCHSFMSQRILSFVRSHSLGVRVCVYFPVCSKSLD